MIRLSGGDARNDAKFAADGTLTDSIIKENAGRIGVRTAPSAAILTVRDTATDVVGVSSDCPSGNAVLGSSNTRVGVRGTSNTGVGVRGSSNTSVGVLGEPQQHRCVWQQCTFPGVIGISVSHVGVFGSSSNDVGVRGIGSLHDGVQGVSSRDDPPSAGVSGSHTGAGYGIYGENLASGLAGFFRGDVDVSGRLRKGSGGFLIDHPLDPANKTLTHSFVESPL